MPAYIFWVFLLGCSPAFLCRSLTIGPYMEGTVSHTRNVGSAMAQHVLSMYGTGWYDSYPMMQQVRVTLLYNLGTGIRLQLQVG